MTHVSVLVPAVARPVDPSRRHYGLSALQGLVATYRARRRFRSDLERMANDNPHLIADIGLTKWQAEAEVAKRFWQV